jgi:hypothetical protein
MRVPRSAARFLALLRCPCLGRVGGDAGDVQVSRAVFPECQRVEPFAEHSVDVEEVRSDDALGLSGEELPPGRTGATGCRINASRVQNLPHCRGGDPMAHLGQLALDAAMSPPRIFLGELQHECLDRGSCWRASGASMGDVVPLSGHEPAVPGEQGAGSDSEDRPPAAAIYQPGQAGEPEPVRGFVTYRGRQLSPKDRVLVSQHEQFGVPRQLATQQHRWDGQQLPGHLVQQRHDHPDMVSTHWYPSLHQRR